MGAFFNRLGPRDKFVEFLKIPISRFKIVESAKTKKMVQYQVGFVTETFRNNVLLSKTVYDQLNLLGD